MLIDLSKTIFHIILIGAIASAFTASANDTPSSNTLRNQIQLTDLITTSPEIIYHEGKKAAGAMQAIKKGFSLDFQIKPENSQGTTITLDIGTGKESRMAYAVVSPDGAGGEDLYVFESSWGSGAYHNCMILLNPRLKQAIYLLLEWDNQPAGVVPGVYTSDNYDAPELSPEKAFLEKIKYEYGFITQEEVESHPENPKYAFYFWAKDNPDPTSDTLHFQKYPGNTLTGSSLKSEVIDGDIRYSLYERHGAIAYDQRRNESWVVLYIPPGTWPQALEKHESLLFVGLYGKGLIVLDVDKKRMREFPEIGEKNIPMRLDIVGNDLVVNGSERIPLSTFSLEQ